MWWAGPGAEQVGQYFLCATSVLVGGARDEAEVSFSWVGRVGRHLPRRSRL